MIMTAGGSQVFVMHSKNKATKTEEAAEEKQLSKDSKIKHVSFELY